jgi:acyl-coenzyme A synthetase/AMP-(fatty) acid ligase
LKPRWSDSRTTCAGTSSRRTSCCRAAASDALRAGLQDHCKRVTAAYSCPRGIEFVEELPKTISGKIRRVELRKRAAEGGLAAPHP